MENVDMQNLAQIIAREVLRQLGSKQPATEQVKPCILVLAPRDCLLVDTLNSSLGDDNDFYFLGESLLDRSPCRHIVPKLTCTAMAALASGGASDETSSLILQLLLEGKEVEVLTYEYQDYSATASNALFAVYEAHAATLEGFGLKPFVPRKQECVRCREKLVTERDVEQAAGASVLMVPHGALVTPLARDAAKNHQMTIQQCL